MVEADQREAGYFGAMVELVDHWQCNYQQEPFLEGGQIMSTRVESTPVARNLKSLLAAAILSGIASLSAFPANAETLNLTLNETDFGFPSSFPTADPGAVWTGTVDAGTYGPTPGGEFLIDTFDVTIGDENGVDVTLNTGNTTVGGTAHVLNDGSGIPDFMTDGADPGLFAGFPHSFFWAIPVSISGGPDVGYQLTFNSIGVNADGRGTWIASLLEFDGNLPITQTSYRFGTYELSEVPEPSTFVLLASAILPLSYCLWRRRRQAGAAA